MPTCSAVRLDRFLSRDERLRAPLYVGVTDLVQRAVARGANEIGPQRFLNDHVGATPPKLQHHFLRHVLRGALIAEHALRERDRKSVV